MREEENGFSKQLSREEKNTCRERESEMAWWSWKVRWHKEAVLRKAGWEMIKGFGFINHDSISLYLLTSHFRPKPKRFWIYRPLARLGFAFLKSCPGESDLEIGLPQGRSSQLDGFYPSVDIWQCMATFLWDHWRWVLLNTTLNRTVSPHQRTAQRKCQ